MTAPKDAATPRPWRYQREGTHRLVVLSRDSGVVPIADVVRASYRSGDESEANAALIIRAVNTHDALVGALKGLVSLIAAEYPQQQEVWLEEARAAIAKAEGK